MNNLPLKALAWKDAAISSEAQHDFFNYRVIPDHDSVDKFAVRYKDSDHRPATGFATMEDAKAWAWDNYNEKMQPYVVPSPTKVYELTFDYDDGYFTVFMTTDEQVALDFIESVKKHDEQFICDTSYDTYEYESINDDYNENHPLKPYASKIFDPIYEDKFSEYMNSYAGHTFASQLSIIDHELFVSKQGE